MPSPRALELMILVGAILEGHFVLNAGNHSNLYVNKDAVYTEEVVNELCLMLVTPFIDSDVDVVAGAAVGGVALTQWAAHHLRQQTGRKIQAIFAEPNTQSVAKADKNPLEIHVHSGPGSTIPITLQPGEELLVKKNDFDINRGYDKIVPGQQVGIVDDVITTGKAVRATIAAVRAKGGMVLWVACLCNRGGVTGTDLDVPELFNLVEITPESWPGDACDLCTQKVPINTEVGKGKAFLERKALENNPA